MFWGHRAEADGRVGKGCLSQWWLEDFEEAGVRYKSAEHYMMAGKARLFGDEEMLAAILASETPGEAKKLGRRVRGFQEATWRAHRFEVVVQGNVAKFGQSPALSAFLLGTSRRVLVEASPKDRIWGIGLAAGDPRAMKPSAWRGENLLGFALMEARARLMAGAAR